MVLVLCYWHWSFWNDVHCYWRYHCSQPKGNLTQDGRQLELRREALGKISLPSFDTWPAWSSWWWWLWGLWPLWSSCLLFMVTNTHVKIVMTQLSYEFQCNCRRTLRAIFRIEANDKCDFASLSLFHSKALISKTPAAWWISSWRFSLRNSDDFFDNMTNIWCQPRWIKHFRHYPRVFPGLAPVCARSLRKTMSRSQNCKNQQNSSKCDVLTSWCRNLVATLIPALHFSLSLAWLSSCCHPPWRRRRRTGGGQCHADGGDGGGRGVVDIYW